MNLKVRLSVMNFLEFAVWGAYLTCMGNFLGNAGMGNETSWFYAIQGIVSIFMPTLMGVVADKWIQPQRLLGLCHLFAGIFMLVCWQMGFNAIEEVSQQLAVNPDANPVYSNKGLFIVMYTISVAFFMPTIALTNTAAFSILKTNGYDTVKDFPPIRVLGTVGFIATMWFVNCATLKDGSFFFSFEKMPGKFQYTNWQFFISGILSIALFLYSFSLPKCQLVKNKAVSLAETFGLKAFRLFKSRQMAIFFIFSALLGMCLQVTNGYAGPFITSFQGSEDPLVSQSFAASNATLLTSISQVSEALCILMIPFFLKRFGIKVVMLMSMFAWVFRFGFFGIGNPAMPGVLLFILSCVVYGVAFDFFNVSGGLFVDQQCEPSIKASAQGLFMMMTNGVGATIGTLVAGEIILKNCSWKQFIIDGEKTLLLVENEGTWQNCWFIFSAFALIVGVSFWLLFKPEKKQA